MRGRADIARTPIAIRSRLDLAALFEDRIRRTLASRLGHAAQLIERGTVRFEDINGPRGGVDTMCRIKIVLSGRPSVQVEETATTPEAAFARAVPRLATAIEWGARIGGLALKVYKARKTDAPKDTTP
jgi:hypothetical protein